MERAVLAKFEQHAELRALLLGTRLAPVVEHTANDSYWGDGGDGSGKNRLGAVLGKVRETLRLRALQEAWTQVLRLPMTCIVLFRHGTSVLCADTDLAFDLQARALKILAEYRGQAAGTPLGDFRVLHLDQVDGWLVGFDHPDVARIVLREEFPRRRLGRRPGALRAALPRSGRARVAWSLDRECPPEMSLVCGATPRIGPMRHELLRAVPPGLAIR